MARKKNALPTVYIENIEFFTTAKKIATLNYVQTILVSFSQKFINAASIVIPITQISQTVYLVSTAFP